MSRVPMSLLRFFLLTHALACGPEESPGGGGAIETTRAAFKNVVNFPQTPANTACGGPQQDRANAGAILLSNRLFQAGGQPMRDCLADAFVSDTELSAADIWVEYNRNVTTNIYCSSNLDATCGGSHDFAACASPTSGEAVTFAFQFLNDINATDTIIAGVLAHELGHNYGHWHPERSTDPEYDVVANQRVRKCVENSNLMPADQSRAQMPGEAELAPVGHFGGSPPAAPAEPLYGIANEFVSGISVSAGGVVNGFEVQFTTAAPPILTRTSPYVGTGAASKQPRLCNSGEFVVGIFGRSGGLVDNLSVICAPASNLSATRDLPPAGGGGGQAFRSMCPAGKAVRAMRARSGGALDQVRIVCDTFGRFFSPNHAPHAAGPVFGSASGRPYQLRCSGNGALSRLVGRSGGLVDRLSGICSPTGGVLPLTPGGPAHPMVPFVGGRGGSAFAPVGCQPDEMMVGLDIRSGGAVDAVRPICAGATQWDTNGAAPFRQLSNSDWRGGTGGSVGQMICPTFQFVVGLNLWQGGTVNGLQLVCADMR